MGVLFQVAIAGLKGQGEDCNGGSLARIRGMNQAGMAYIQRQMNGPLDRRSPAVAEGGGLCGSEATAPGSHSHSSRGRGGKEGLLGVVQINLSCLLLVDSEILLPRATPPSQLTRLLCSSHSPRDNCDPELAWPTADDCSLRSAPDTVTSPTTGPVHSPEIVPDGYRTHTGPHRQGYHS